MNQVPKKAIYFLVILIVVVALIVFALWKGLIGSDSSEIDLTESRIMEVDLDLSLLETEKVKALQPFEKIPELEEESKRNNPFSPYKTSEPSESE